MEKPYFFFLQKVWGKSQKNLWPMGLKSRDFKEIEKYTKREEISKNPDYFKLSFSEIREKTIR